MEENRKGPGIFYAVTGVATLVVAIIGATFAYFTATAATESTDDIEGTTAEAASLELVVDKMAPTGLATEKMIPLDSDELMDDALSHACVADNNYVACQVYKIEVISSTVEDVNVIPTVTLVDENNYFKNLKFQLLKGTTKDDYAIDSDKMATAAVDSVATPLESRTSKSGLGNSAVWYIVVWLEEAEGDNQTEAGKTFTGKVTVNATDATGGQIGGQLTATFTA